MWNSFGSSDVSSGDRSCEDLIITECSRDRSSSNNITPNSPGRVGEESSEGEFVEEEKPWPPEDGVSIWPSEDGVRIGRTRNKSTSYTPRVPRPHSHLFRLAGRARASKHSRRWENSMYLSSLYNIPEEELEEASTILPPHDSPFTRLHTSDKNMQIWSSFTSHSEEEQHHMTTTCHNKGGVVKHQRDQSNLPDEDREGRQQKAVWSSLRRIAGERMKKIDPRIRAIFQHNRHLPMEALCSLEEELLDLFQLAGPHIIFLALQTNSFFRLLLHGLSQYLGLKSTTEHVSGTQVVVVEHEGCDPFIPPATPLSLYLQSKASR